MIKSDSRWYFETSAVNLIARGRSVEDAIATRQLQLYKNRRWCISPTVVWELLSCANRKQGQHLVEMSLRLFEPKLLPSAEELIIRFIEAGCPREEIYNEEAYISYSNLADAWYANSIGESENFDFSEEELRKKILIFIALSKDLRRIIKNTDVIFKFDRSPSDIGIEITIHSIFKELSWIKAGECCTHKQMIIYKISIFYILFLLCAEGSFDNTPIKRFWSKLKIESTLQRIRYVFHNLEVLVHRGPFLQMAVATYEQFKTRFSRGVFLDSLHALYLPYIDSFLTQDKAIVALSNDTSNPNWHKIMDLNIYEFEAISSKTP